MFPDFGKQMAAHFFSFAMFFKLVNPVTKFTAILALTKIENNVR